jgi:hypothetical protein
MADATFTDAFDWFAAHNGQRVWVETGCRDPRAEQLADFAVLRVLTTIGEPYMVNDPERQTGVLSIPFLNDDDEHGGIEVQPECLKDAKIHLGLLKVWQHDIYFVVTPIRTPHA